MIFTDVSYCISVIYYLYFINSRFNFYVGKISYLCIVIQKDRMIKCFSNN